MALAIDSDMMLSSVMKHFRVNKLKRLYLVLFHSKREPTISPIIEPIIKIT